jgi:hypothetical protein
MAKCLWSKAIAFVVFLGSCQEAEAFPQGVFEEASPSQVVEMMKLYYQNVRPYVLRPGETAKGNPELETAFQDYILHYIRNEQRKQDTRQSVIRWSNISANITFILAHMLLVLGLVLAVWEWRKAGDVRKKSKAENLEIEIKLESLAMKGVQSGYLILVVSLLFYFLYLKFVYPVLVV